MIVAIVASIIVGKPVPISCQPLGQHAGYYDGYYDADWDAVFLSRQVCAGFDRGAALWDRANVLIVLAHEDSHAAGIYDEHDADCNALRVLPRILKAVRFPKPLFAIQLARQLHSWAEPPYAGPC